MASLTAALPLKLVQAVSASDDDFVELMGVNAFEATGIFNLSTFSQQVGTPFKIQTGRSTINSTLVQARDLVRGKGDCFLLSFRGPLGAPIKQGTYFFEHSWLGRFAMFIVPGGRDAKGAYYQAVFNRMLR
jgi:hypothetical protein